MAGFLKSTIFSLEINGVAQGYVGIPGIDQSGSGKARVKELFIPVLFGPYESQIQSASPKIIAQTSRYTGKVANGGAIGIRALFISITTS